MADYLDQLYGRGLISASALERLAPGGPQRPSRSDMLRDALTPSYLRDTPSSPQADRALADPNGRPSKIGPPSGPPTGMQMVGGLAGDVGLNSLPLSKILGVMTPIKGAGVRMGIPEAGDIAAAANRIPGALQKSIDRYSDALLYNKITPQEFEGFMEALGVDKSSIPEILRDSQRQHDALRQSIREELMGMREEGSLRGPDERAKDARSQFRIVPKEK